MRTFYEQTIIDNIDFEGYGFANDMDLYNKIKTTYNIFKKEYGFMIERVGEVVAFAEWLSGLPSVLTVPFYYNEMVQNAKDFGLEIKDEELFCNDYFDNLSKAFFTLKNNL